jgi:hypothetical protein
VAPRLKQEEQHLLFMKIYSMPKMHAIIYQVSMYVIDILLFYTINQKKQPKNLISKKRKNLLRKQNKDLVLINLISH